MKKEGKDKKEKRSFKELWIDPKTNALIKLGLYGVFFIIIYVFVLLGGNNSNNSKREYTRSTTTTTTTSREFNYSDMKLKLLTKDHEIIYKINDYYITGNIKNGELLATVERKDNVYKIKYDGEKIFRVKKEEYIEDDGLLDDIKRDYLLPGKIVEIISEPKNIATIDKKEETYNYDYDNIQIKVYLKYGGINRIVIKDDNIEYDLEYKEIINEF